MRLNRLPIDVTVTSDWGYIMIIVCGGIKGGSGKTTVAVNLAAMRSLAGAEVLLVDADDQATASDFTAWREDERDGGAGYTCVRLSDAAVRNEVAKLRSKYTDVIIDTGGRDTTSQRAALTIADIMLVPFLPRSFDIWTLEKVARLVTEIWVVNPDLKPYGFINRADPAGRDNGEAATEIIESEVFRFLDASIGSRKAVSNSAAMGLAAIENKPRNVAAIREFRLLYQRVFNVDFALPQRHHNVIASVV